MLEQSRKVLKMSAHRDASMVARRGHSQNGTKVGWDKIAPMRNNLANVSDESFAIPEGELTPSVRKALISLFRETERLRQKLERANARLEDAAKYADRDVLLPILNRRAFVREVSRFIAFAERYGTSSCLIYIDLNGFKVVNDVYGHVAGDALLKHFADIMLGQIRDTDIFARLGGDEFGVVLAHTVLDQAQRKAEKFIRALEDSSPCWEGRPIALGFSYGVYKLRAGDTADAAIAQADKAMYVRKRKAYRANSRQALGDDVGQKRIFNL
jgi:diguanylate cyclase (GGDEF)-like protein